MAIEEDHVPPGRAETEVACSTQHVDSETAIACRDADQVNVLGFRSLQQRARNDGHVHSGVALARDEELVGLKLGEQIEPVDDKVGCKPETPSIKKRKLFLLLWSVLPLASAVSVSFHAPQLVPLAAGPNWVQYLQQDCFD